MSDHEIVYTKEIRNGQDITVITMKLTEAKQKELDDWEREFSAKHPIMGGWLRQRRLSREYYRKASAALGVRTEP
jgi:hypothetical protein